MLKRFFTKPTVIAALKRIAVGATVLATLLTLGWSVYGEHDFEVAATRAALHYESLDKCPLSSAAMRKENVGMASICSTFGLTAYEHARHYPEIAGKLLAVYGDVQEFHQVLGEYGHRVLPVIEYFRDRHSREFTLRANAGSALDRLVSRDPNNTQPIDLTDDQHGLIAIFEIKRSGHLLLAQFEIVDGKAKRKQAMRIALTLMGLVTGGITDLEATLTRGEKPTLSQVGFAVLDVVVVVGSVAAVAKTFQVAKVAGKGAFLAKTGAVVRTITTVGKVAGIAAGVSILYFAVTDPYLLASAAGWIAENIFGLPQWVGAFVLALICATVLMLFIECFYTIAWYGTWFIHYPIRLALRYTKRYILKHPKHDFWLFRVLSRS